MVEQFTGTMRILRTADSLTSLGTMYPHNTDVLEQYVENGYDAGATQVIVVLEKNRIAIFDDGHGLVPRMSPDDYDTLGAYKEDLDSQKISGDLPFEILFPELSDSPSLRSFQWMMECIGLSSKRISHETQTRGIKGLGALSFQQIANRAVWYSKPRTDLALAYYKHQEVAQNPPTAVLRSPTVDQLRNQIIRYEISETEPLKNPFLGEEVQSGTLVELTELREGVERSLRPNSVIRSLQERFGNDIRIGRLKIQVIDRLSNEGESVTEVPPSTYPGMLIFHTESALRGGKGPFGVEVYFDPLGRALYPKLARKGSEVCPITQLSDFNRYPWNSGRLSGLVSYPDLSDEEAPWDAQKSLPLAGPVYNQWQKRVEEMVGDIETEIEKIEEERRSTQLEEFSKVLGQEMVEAMREIPEFRDLVVRPKREVGKKRPQKPEDRVIATVTNEHDDSVIGARVELWTTSPTELVRSAVTKRSGVISFGRNPYDRYRLRIAELPTGAVIDGMDEYVFNLRASMPGVRENFRVINGEPPRPKPKPINQITPYLHGWSNTDEPYIQRLEFGVVEINTEGVELREAISRNDVDGRVTLCAQYMASAAAEFAAAEDESREDTLINASRLFGVLLRRISSKRRRS